MIWNHRICKKVVGDEIVFGIHEAYYNDGRESIWAVTTEPTRLMTVDDDINLSDEEALRRLSQQLDWMKNALINPIIDLDTYVFSNHQADEES